MISMLGSFWDHNIASSNIEQTLKKPGLTLEQLLEEEDIIQECKHQNSELVEFLSRPEHLIKMVEYVTAAPPVESEAKADANLPKYAYLSSEIFCCEVPSLVAAVADSKLLMRSLFRPVDRPAPQDPTSMAYFCKVAKAFLEQRTDSVLRFLEAEAVLPRLLKHIGLFAVLDLVTCFWSEAPAKASVDIPSWLVKQNLIGELIDLISSSPDAATRDNSAAALLNALDKERLRLHVHGAHAPSAGHPKPGSEAAAVLAAMGLVAHPTVQVDLSPLVAELQQPVRVKALGDAVCASLSQSGASAPLLAVLSALADLSPSPAAKALDAAEAKEKEKAEQDARNAKDAMRGGDDEAADDEQAELAQFARALGIGLTPSSSAAGSGRKIRGDIVHNPDNPFEFADEDETKADAKADTAPAADKAASPSPADSTPSPASALSSSPLPDPGLPSSLEPVLAHIRVLSEALRAAPDSSLVTQFGQTLKPLGEARLKVVEFFLALVRSGHSALDAEIARLHVLPAILDLFFAHVWNNLLHRLVEQLISRVLRSTSAPLKAELFESGRLLQRLIDSEAQNSQAATKPRGFRLGVMAYVVRISNTIIDSAKNDAYVKQQLEATEGWADFVKGPLAKSNEDQSTKLGGGAIEMRSGLDELAALGLDPAMLSGGFAQMLSGDAFMKAMGMFSADDDDDDDDDGVPGFSRPGGAQIEVIDEDEPARPATFDEDDEDEDDSAPGATLRSHGSAASSGIPLGSFAVTENEADAEQHDGFENDDFEADFSSMNDDPPK